MPKPANLQRWKVTCTWTSLPADGSVTASYVFQTMAISSADCLAKAQAAYSDYNARAPVTFGTPSTGWTN